VIVCLVKLLFFFISLSRLPAAFLVGGWMQGERAYRPVATTTIHVFYAS